MQFRTDINGLRAYAVLAVIFFHFNKDWLPGGFTGVDVFFVISGYLMTSIIFRGLDVQSFSILKFYASRIKRIIPALLVLVIILMILGYFLIGPMSYRNLSKESIRSLLFVSNFLYWRDSGYFDAGAFSKPLLHTWSLSVEWQFYILYPIVLTICAKFLTIATLKKIVLTFALLSLGITVYFSYQSPIAAYFLLPTRIWEMLLGGLVFLYPFNLTKHWQKYTLEFGGLALIILSFFIINEYIPWPGYMALIPTMGAFCLMQANGNSFITNNPIFQKIGLWSYSLYLYHWPIVYINHRYNLQMNFFIFMLLTFTLALLSYYFIEKKKWSVKCVLITLFIALIPIYGVYKTKGAEFRVSGKDGLTAEQMYGGGIFPQYQLSDINPVNNDIDYIMIGDSVSRQYAHFLLQTPLHIRTIYADACLFSHNYSVYLNNQSFEKCNNITDQFYTSFIKDNPTTPIIWAQGWNGYTLLNKANNTDNNLLSLKIDQAQYFATLSDEIKYMINESPDRNIYLIGSYVFPTYNVYECLSAQELSRFAEICDEFIPRTEPPINTLLQKIADQYPNVYLIDPNNGYCNEQGCRMIINNEPMFTDFVHLTTYGSEVVGKYIFDKIKQYELEYLITKDSTMEQ